MRPGMEKDFAYCPVIVDRRYIPEHTYTGCCVGAILQLLRLESESKFGLSCSWATATNSSENANQARQNRITEVSVLKYEVIQTTRLQFSYEGLKKRSAAYSAMTTMGSEKKKKCVLQITTAYI